MMRGMPGVAAQGARMSSLVVLLPSSDRVVPAGWEATPMLFALLGRKGEMLRAGHAAFDALPQAGETVLLVAARDTLMLHAKLPPVSGPRLRRVLPNVVEDHLIQDPQRCHVAVDPVLPAPKSDLRCLAVIDREWFVSVIERFAEAGHRRVRAVPLIRCIPLPDVAPAAEPEIGSEVESVPPLDANSSVASDVEANDQGRAASVLIVQAKSGQSLGNEFGSGGGSGGGSEGGNEHPEPDVNSIEWVELALRQDSLGLGMSVNAVQLEATLAELAARQPLEVYALTLDGRAEPDRGSGIERGIERSIEPTTEPTIEPRIKPVAADTVVLRLPLAFAAPGEAPESRHAETPAVPSRLAGRTLPLAAIAHAALACRFNLCQFELANAGGNRGAAAGLKPWRVALGFLAASIVVSIIALNVQWWQLRHHRDALEDQMTQMVQTAFPGSAMVLGPHEQMALDLTRLRSTAGTLRADDFLALAASLAHALGPIPSVAIQALDYSGGSLEVSFKPGTEIDADGFKRRLATSGLSVEEDDGKWKLRSAQSRPH
jgi:general secretion pathway protein L